jgi:hypothetical protein
MEIKSPRGFAKWADRHFKCDWEYNEKLLYTYTEEDLSNAFKFSKYNEDNKDKK